MAKSVAFSAFTSTYVTPTSVGNLPELISPEDLSQQGSFTILTAEEAQVRGRPKCRFTVRLGSGAVRGLLLGDDKGGRHKAAVAFVQSQKGAEVTGAVLVKTELSRAGSYRWDIEAA